MYGAIFHAEWYVAGQAVAETITVDKWWQPIAQRIFEIVRIVPY